MSYHIAIEGVIGVGKTTLARYLHEALNATLILEVFEENPFLASFYQDRERYAFQTQVFFLLSRYHQQQRLHELPRPLVSDYIFDKDQLFARQNLHTDELDTYTRVYEALAQNITRPDLVVYLRADTPVLMARIAARDRPYERDMDITYIDSLRLAYNHFFASYDDASILTIDSSQLDFVQNMEDRQEIINQVRGSLGIGPRQTVLPGLDTLVATPAPPSPERSDISDTEEQTFASLQNSERRLGDFQQFHHEFDRLKNFNPDILLNFAKLQEEVGELASELVNYWRSDDLAPSDALRHELADVLAYILKLANYTGVDLETAYLEKMLRNQKRAW